MYMVEAFCMLGKFKEALNTINSCNLSSMNQNLKCRNILGLNHTYYLQNMSPKLVLSINIFAIHLLNNNLTQANNMMNNINSMIETIANGGQIQYPLPYLNLLIYYHLKNGIFSYLFFLFIF